MSTDTTVERKILAIPYFFAKDAGELPKDVIQNIYRRLVRDGILQDLCHEREMTEQEFVAFVNDPKNLFYIFFDMVNAKFLGVAWLENISETMLFTKGMGAFAFFKEFQRREITIPCGLEVLNHWFNILGFGLIFGITPVSNKAAVRYCKSIGFKYAGPVPSFTVYRGQIDDAMIATLTRDEFLERTKNLNIGRVN